MNQARIRFKLTGHTDINVPLKSVPYAHQTRAFGFTSSIDSSGLFMDQGTGKTFVTIAWCGSHYLAGRVERILVVTPKTVKQVWPAQLLEHADFPWSASVNKKPPIVGKQCQFWMVSYDSVKGMMKDIKRWKPDAIIWDEGHRLKNKGTDRFKSNRDVARKVPLRMILTGTPIGKCLTEAWALYNLIDPDVFGTWGNFVNRYCLKGGFMGKKIVGYQNEQEFYEKFHSKAFRVTKDECLDLPDLMYQHHYVEATPKDAEVYDRFTRELFIETDDGEITSPGAAVTAMKLRQMTGGSVKTDSGGIARLATAKLAAFRDFMESRTSGKTVVFFSFTQEIEEAKKICLSIGIPVFILSGKSKDRDSFEARFQGHTGAAVALIQVQTGAEGLTLHSADYALYYSPSYSYVLFAQSRDRIYRIGQKKKVTIGFLIVKETVDEQVVATLESNGRLVTETLETNREYNLRK